MIPGQIVRAYDKRLVRAYARIRFLIIRRRFLEEIARHLPERGSVLDVGCGFGLFALYFAMGSPGRVVRGLDREPGRIAAANRAAAALGLTNVSFTVGDLREGVEAGRYAAAYMIDILHHVPRETVGPLLREVREALPAGGTLLIKDIARTPALKRWFTFWLDKAMAFRDRVHYWDSRELVGLLESMGFVVRHERWNDILPYPHILYICQRAL